MNRWKEIELLTTHLIKNHKVSLNNGTLYVHPIAYKELVEQTEYNPVNEGYLIGEKFNITKRFISSNANDPYHTYVFCTNNNEEIFLSGELYREIKSKE